jgi:hypothetical protein
MSQQTEDFVGVKQVLDICKEIAETDSITVEEALEVVNGMKGLQPADTEQLKRLLQLAKEVAGEDSLSIADALEVVGQMRQLESANIDGLKGVLALAREVAGEDSLSVADALEVVGAMKDKLPADVDRLKQLFDLARQVAQEDSLSIEEALEVVEQMKGQGPAALAEHLKQRELTQAELARQNEFAHAERIKALEVGRPLPDVEARKAEAALTGARADISRARAAALIGTLVPLVTGAAAVWATLAVIARVEGDIVGLILGAIWGAFGGVNALALLVGLSGLRRSAPRAPRDEDPFRGQQTAFRAGEPPMD